MKKLFVGVIASVYVSLTLSAQTSTKLDIGDHVPDLVLHYASNTRSYPASLQSFKGKLLILDFWSTACTGCLESWPKLLKLQHEFDNDIQIVLINTFESPELINKMIARQKANGIDMTLPAAAGDSSMMKLFPTPSVPHIIWIDQDGYIRSITDGASLQSGAIRTILDRHPLAMEQKKDFEDYHPWFKKAELKTQRAPLFIGGNGVPGTYLPLLGQSVLTGNIRGIWPIMFHLDSKPENKTLSLLNSSIKDIYRVVFNNDNFKSTPSESIERLRENRIDWGVSDERYSAQTPEGLQDSNHWYSYQLTMPSSTTSGQIQQYAQADLKKYFQLDVHWEKRKVKCLVFSATDTLLTKAKATGAVRKINPATGKVLWAGTPITKLISYLSNTITAYSRSPYPIVDETGFKGTVGGFELCDDYIDFAKQLRKCGLDLSLQERYIDILVISQQNDDFPSSLEYPPNANIVPWSYE